jgi:Family of unknown function (DUF6263)
MKKTIGIICTGLTCLLLAGCSKPKDAAVNNKPGEAPATASASAAEKPKNPEGPVELKLKWTVGKRYLEEMAMTQNSEITMPGAPKPMQQQTDMTQDYSLSAVKARSEGGSEVEMKFISQKMSTKTEGRDAMSFDSTADPATDAGNPVAPMLRKAVGAHITYLTDSDGKIEKVQGFPEFIKQLTGGVSAQSQQMMKSMFSEDSLKQYASGAQGLPDKPVKVGDTWPVHMDMNMGPMGNMTLNLKFKFAGWEQHNDHNCVLLTYTGDMASKGGPTSNAMKISIENGKLSGKNWFDPELGVMVENTGDQTMTVKMSMQGKDMTSKMKQNIDVKLTALEDISK